MFSLDPSSPMAFLEQAVAAPSSARRQSASPARKQAAAAPARQPAAAAPPAYQQPAAPAPVYQQPAAYQSPYQQPAAPAPVYQQPVAVRQPVAVAAEPAEDEWTRKHTIFTVCFGAILLIAILVPISFHGVAYDEYALDRNAATNHINYGTVYDNGLYQTGVGHSMVRFQRTYHNEEFDDNDLRVFSKEGLEFGFQCTFQWRPIKEAIPSIHKKFRSNYRGQVINRVIATIKNTVTQFTTDDFVTKRAEIDKVITSAIGDAVDELGFDIPKDKFQFAKPLLPDNVRSRFLQTQVQLVRNDEQALRLRVAAVTQETAVLVSAINSNATRLFNEATSTSVRILAEANAKAFGVINTAEQDGLSMLFDSMNVTSSVDRELLRKILAIESNPNITMYFGGVNLVKTV